MLDTKEDKKRTRSALGAGGGILNIKKHNFVLKIRY